ncbi:hypothetical protein [Thalassolituus oleivorans]|jgi:hypothetical protein|uniref:hypothetical protein n=1 Tax=Thalassolituus oleivorans TaxID=187493 RepID=UPI0023F0266E|nr:hypothetical protein [Thalassolituus oleivorans]
MCQINELTRATELFFSKHWEHSSKKSTPYWKWKWDWASSVPYHNKGGVYALLDENNRISYIGLGASIGGGKYKEHGISRRLLSHVIKKDPSKKGAYVPKSKWSNIKDIGAIGFDYEDSYLAASLEAFLIRELKPLMNSVSKK